MARSEKCDSKQEQTTNGCSKLNKAKLATTTTATKGPESGKRERTDSLLWLSMAFILKTIAFGLDVR